jgi:hypothetical protein
LTVPPSLIETSANANQSLGLTNSVRSTITQDLTRPSNLPPVAKVPPARQGPFKEQQIWFRDDFDTKGDLFDFNVSHEFYLRLSPECRCYCQTFPQ